MDTVSHDDADSQRRSRGSKAREAFRTISEVADDLDLPQHVLRFWESKFSSIKPMKRGGNRRYYRPEDVQVIKAIKKLLHSDGYTIRGVQKLFKEQGLRQTIDMALEQSTSPSPSPSEEVLSDQTTSFSEMSETQVLSVDETGLVNDTQQIQPSEAHKSNLATILAELKAIRALLD